MCLPSLGVPFLFVCVDWFGLGRRFSESELRHMF